jgi:hypothetical protein
MNTPITGPADTGRLIDAGDRYATIERYGERRTQRLHRGCRFGYLGSHPLNPALMVLAFEGGPGPGPAEETVAVSVSADGLEALAHDLLAAVERHRAGRAIDWRYLI